MTSSQPPRSGDQAKPPVIRGEERRHNNQLDSPPYTTKDGVVTVDRRSHIERRSCWIRDFQLSDDDKA